MSTHDPPQFTPAQVLDAARRAEAEVRNEFAHKLYTHLAENYPGSSEAGAALQGLARLSAASAQSPLPPFNPGPVAIDSRFEPQATSAPPALGNPFEAPRGAEPRYGQPAHQQPMFPQWEPEDPLLPTIARAGGKGEVELPAPCRDYVSARFLARLVAWFGALQILAGLAILPVAIVSPRSLAGLPLIGALVSSPLMGAWLLAAGVSQIVLGQLVRALLEQANATRDMAALMRARSGEPSGSSKRSRRRRRR